MKVQQLGDDALKQIAGEVIAALADSFGPARVAAFLQHDPEMTRALAHQTFLAVRKYLVEHP